MNTRVANQFDDYHVDSGPEFESRDSRFDVDRIMDSIRNFATV